MSYVNHYGAPFIAIILGWMIGGLISPLYFGARHWAIRFRNAQEAQRAFEARTLNSEYRVANLKNRAS
jgi:hypothetical protein